MCFFGVLVFGVSFEGLLGEFSVGLWLCELLVGSRATSYGMFSSIDVSRVF